MLLGSMGEEVDKGRAWSDDFTENDIFFILKFIDIFKR